MPVRVEAGSQIIAPREAEPGQEIEGLPAHRPDAVDDRAGIGLCVLQRPVQVVDHGQPALGHVGLGSLPGLAHLPGAPLAHVVQLGQGAQPLILQLGDPGRHFRDGFPGRDLAGVAIPGVARPGVTRLGVTRLGVVRPGGVSRLDVDDLGVDDLGFGLGALAPVTHGW
jgi:hypothetical protein